ncbi:4'-phosphopantetheinyl transferase family protein [Flagellimonas meridianipacifica]|uniref:4'-phosphopantetheinyl transferase superfamily protein n=1 Tax=Flagellimonas meridianipacifica TaxID=1080225 RepID=A0A2T0MG83_9FLAO|nr:4'-phosphopantetheinyl transferase superfamily protein [Allomuricauda pacifica]PRX56591.1 4'-phosphopantetheinyl transferase superfamily protein [Allomuricauda pacifica]
MPIYKSITVSPNTTAYLWKVTESEHDLAKGVELTTHCQNRLESMKSEMHRRAFLSIRHLFFEAGYEDKDVYYSDFGKPYLKDGNHISITHSHNFTGIIIGKKEEVGIDIEKQREKILRIAYKFTPIHEYRTLANTEAIIRKLTIVWGAKESLYKIYGEPGLSFLKHIDVSDFRFDDLKTKAKVRYQGQKSEFGVDFLEFEGFTCVYAQKED